MSYERYCKLQIAQLLAYVYEPSHSSSSISLLLSFHSAQITSLLIFPRLSPLSPLIFPSTTKEKIRFPPRTTHHTIHILLRSRANSTSPSPLHLSSLNKPIPLTPTPQHHLLSLLHPLQQRKPRLTFLTPIPIPIPLPLLLSPHHPFTFLPHPIPLRPPHPQQFHPLHNPKSIPQKRTSEENKHNKYRERDIASAGIINCTRRCMFIDILINQSSIYEERGAGYEERGVI